VVVSPLQIFFEIDIMRQCCPVNSLIVMPAQAGIQKVVEITGFASFAP
jgi:hypothetical protein